ncbi:MAG: 30S ribosomal protein S16 [Clostridia bacterium]|nr:30S ribosomal protein S16 [Clostridia bacterium]
MALRIRLTRTGAIKQPHYRLVVADSRSPRDGRFVEIIGHYNPRTQPVELVVDAERAAEWLGRGARPSDTVRALLVKAGVEAAKNGTRLASAAEPAEGSEK